MRRIADGIRLTGDSKKNLSTCIEMEPTMAHLFF